MNNFMVIKSRPWYDKNFVNLEAALEILSTANGFRSAWIFMERKKEFPNQKKIDQWRKEQIDFLNKIQEIRSGNQKTMDYVINKLADENIKNFPKAGNQDDQKVA